MGVAETVNYLESELETAKQDAEEHFAQYFDKPPELPSGAEAIANLVDTLAA